MKNIDLWFQLKAFIFQKQTLVYSFFSYRILYGVSSIVNKKSTLAKISKVDFLEKILEK